MLLSLRGTNGSGKSTVIRKFFEANGGGRPIYSLMGPRLPEAYSVTVPGVKRPVYVLGPYNVTACGGCDRIIPFDNIPKLIEKYAAKGHVLFEGVIVGSIYGQVGELLEPYKKEAVLLFLDTTLEECIRRVKSRRDNRADEREFNPKNLATKYKATQRVKERAMADGIMRVVDVSSDDAHKVMVKLLKGAK